MRFELLAFVGGHISPKNTEFGPCGPCVHCAAIPIVRLAFVGVEFVLREIAEWLVRVDCVR